MTLPERSVVAEKANVIFVVVGSEAGVAAANVMTGKKVDGCRGEESSNSWRVTRCASREMCDEMRRSSVVGAGRRGKERKVAGESLVTGRRGVVVEMRGVGEDGEDVVSFSRSRQGRLSCALLLLCRKHCLRQIVGATRAAMLFLQFLFSQCSSSSSERILRVVVVGDTDESNGGKKGRRREDKENEGPIGLILSGSFCIEAARPSAVHLLLLSFSTPSGHEKLVGTTNEPSCRDWRRTDRGECGLV